MNDYIYKLIEIKSKFVSNDIKVLIDNVINIIKKNQNDNEKELGYIYNNIINIIEDTNKDKEIIKKVQEELNNLEKENKQLKEEIFYLKDEIKYLKDDNKYLKNKDFINKLLICFQDLNREYLLEKNLNHPFYKYIYRIRNCRMNNCHYLEDGQDINILNYKKYILYNILKKLDNEIILQFEKTYKCLGLINKMIEFTSQFNKKIEIDEEEKEYIDIWWNE